jgi:hypothetical protein
MRSSFAYSGIVLSDVRLPPDLQLIRKNSEGAVTSSQDEKRLGCPSRSDLFCSGPDSAITGFSFVALFLTMLPEPGI